MSTETNLLETSLTPPDLFNDSLFVLKFKPAELLFEIPIGVESTMLSESSKFIVSSLISSIGFNLFGAANKTSLFTLSWFKSGAPLARVDCKREVYEGLLKFVPLLESVLMPLKKEGS